MAPSSPLFMPQLAVSAAIIRDGKVLLMRRARDPALGLFTLPGGRVEPGETVLEAVTREIREETALAIAIAGLAGTHDAIKRDAAGRLVHHYVILAFAARWQGGDVVLNDEHDACRWLTPAELGTVATTEGLPAIMERALALTR